jgi:hypothetical protein
MQKRRRRGWCPGSRLYSFAFVKSQEGRLCGLPLRTFTRRSNLVVRISLKNQECRVAPLLANDSSKDLLRDHHYFFGMVTAKQVLYLPDPAKDSASFSVVEQLIAPSRSGSEAGHAPRFVEAKEVTKLLHGAAPINLVNSPNRAPFFKTRCTKSLKRCLSLFWHIQCNIFRQERR